MSSLYPNRLPFHETPAISEHTQEAGQGKIGAMIDTAKGKFEALGITAVSELSPAQIDAIRVGLQTANDNRTPQALAA